MLKPAKREVCLSIRYFSLFFLISFRGLLKDWGEGGRRGGEGGGEINDDANAAKEEEPEEEEEREEQAGIRDAIGLQKDIYAKTRSTPRYFVWQLQQLCEVKFTPKITSHSILHPLRCC